MAVMYRLIIIWEVIPILMAYKFTICNVNLFIYNHAPMEYLNLGQNTLNSLAETICVRKYSILDGSKYEPCICNKYQSPILKYNN